MKVKNTETGEFFQTDPTELRLSRLKKRLSVFSDWQKLVEEVHSSVDVIMVTLTYKGVEDWKPKHVTEFVQKIRRFLGWRLYGYFWVAEMQERGAVHYHVIFVVKQGTKIPKPDEEGYWTYGMTRVERVQHIYSYLAKYLSKDEQKAQYPKGIRIFGFSVYIVKDLIKMWKLPRWLQDKIQRLLHIFDDDRLERHKLKRLEGLRKVKGGYTCAGHFIASPYRFSW